MYLEQTVMNEEGGSPVEPEINLIGAVIYRAIRDVLNPEQMSEAQQNQRDAAAWLRLDSKFGEDDADTEFSFAWCCSKLDLCPYIIRRRVRFYRANGIQVDV